MVRSININIADILSNNFNLSLVIKQFLSIQYEKELCMLGNIDTMIILTKCSEEPLIVWNNSPSREISGEVDRTGLEPVTSALSRQRSKPTELAIQRRAKIPFQA
jgi:hypothetical protein